MPTWGKDSICTNTTPKVDDFIFSVKAYQWKWQAHVDERAQNMSALPGSAGFFSVGHGTRGAQRRFGDLFVLPACKNIFSSRSWESLHRLWKKAWSVLPCPWAGGEENNSTMSLSSSAALQSSVWAREAHLNDSWLSLFSHLILHTEAESWALLKHKSQKEGQEGRSHMQKLRVK